MLPIAVKATKDETPSSETPTVVTTHPPSASSAIARSMPIKCPTRVCPEPIIKRRKRAKEKLEHSYKLQTKPPAGRDPPAGRPLLPSPINLAARRVVIGSEHLAPGPRCGQRRCNRTCLPTSHYCFYDRLIELIKIEVLTLNIGFPAPAAADRKRNSEKANPKLTDINKTNNGTLRSGVFFSGWRWRSDVELFRNKSLRHGESAESDGGRAGMKL